MKKVLWLLALIIVIVVIIFATHKQKPISESSITTSNTNGNLVTEKKVICNVGSEVESDWCKLPTGQRLLLGMTGDAVYDNEYYYSFSRNDIDQGVRLWKNDNFACSDHVEMVGCDDSAKLTLTVSGSRDLYNSILKQLNDTYLQMRKDSDPQ